MVPPLPAKRASSLPILGWVTAGVLILAATALLITVIRDTATRQSQRLVDVKRLYVHCKLVREAVAADARDLLEPARKDEALMRFGATPLRTVREIQLCSRKDLKLLDVLPRCTQARDFPCLALLAKEALAAVDAASGH